MTHTSSLTSLQRTVLGTAACLLLTACAGPNGAEVERFDQAGSNELSPLAWSSDRVELTDADRVVVSYGGEPSVLVELETCRQSIVDGGVVELGIEDEDGCVTRVVYSELLHDCDSCEGLDGGVKRRRLDAFFGPEHRWGSVSGTVAVQTAEQAIDVTIEADMRPVSLSLGENTAEGTFRLRSDIFLADFDDGRR